VTTDVVFADVHYTGDLSAAPGKVPAYSFIPCLSIDQSQHLGGMFFAANE
jgi:hypothetical protein